MGLILGGAVAAALGVGGFLGYQGYQAGTLRLPLLPPSQAAVNMDAWAAVDQSDAAALQSFIAASPESPFLGAAQAMLAEMETERFDAAMQAIDSGPVEAFLATFPASARAPEARMRLDRIRGEAPGALIPLPGDVREAAYPSETGEAEPAEETAPPTAAPATPAPEAPRPAAPAPEVRGAPL